MSYNYWNHFKKTTPKPVEDGIKARSRRGDFGEGWVAKSWIEVLESSGRSNRLRRGKRYARKGQVREYHVEEGKVRAEVQGSRSDPYVVEIELEAFSHETWEQIIEEMKSVPLFYTAFSTSTVPIEFKDLLEELELDLVPSSLDDLQTSCSCPDIANPCKHIAAVYYLLGEAFDEDPFLLFQIRGKGREELLEDLPSCDQEKERNSDPSVKPDFDPSLDTSSDCFWAPGRREDEKESEGAGAGTSSKVECAVLKLLGPPKFLPKAKKYRQSLEKAYKMVSERQN